MVSCLTLSVTGRPNEAEFIEAVEAAKSRFDAGEIDRDEYHERVARASSR
ncbi:SHOCT domain-containing protein [Halalkalicoccus salilacus]